MPGAREERTIVDTRKVLRFVVTLACLGALLAAGSQLAAAQNPAGDLVPAGDVDLSGLWEFTDSFSDFQGDTLKLFHAGDQLFGIIEKGDYDHILRGTVQGSTVQFELAPTDITGLNPTEPMSDDEMREIMLAEMQAEAQS